MSVREEVESRRPELQRLFDRLQLRKLFAYFDGPESYASLTFVGDFNTDDLLGYADRFFDCEEGLLRIFHRRIHLVEQQIFDRQAHPQSVQALELRHAS